MIHTFSWEQQSFVDVDDNVTSASRFGRLHYRSPSESDPSLLTPAMVTSRSADGQLWSVDDQTWSVDDGTSMPLTCRRRQRSARRRTLNEATFSSSTSTVDQPPCVNTTTTTSTPTTESVSGTSPRDLSIDIRTAPALHDFQKLSMRSNDGDRRRQYENVPPPTITGDGHRLPTWDNSAPEVTSSAGTRSPFPRGATARKVSSSSSVCDSAALELCTASSSSICSSCCSESTASVVVASAAAPVAGDAPPSLPDSGNGSGSWCCDGAGVRSLSGLVSPEPSLPPPGNSTLSGRGARLPATTAASYCLVASFLPAWDAERLETVYARLTQSGFYYGRLTLDAAAERLRHASVGTFLLRDSSDDRHLFTISVQTCRGTTSIRVVYHAGLFRLDCRPDQEHLMPTFDCALRLVAHYVRLCRLAAGSSSHVTGSSSYVLLETGGRRDTPVLLRRPLYRRVDRLGHLCRRAIHRALSHGPTRSDVDRGPTVDRLQLIPSLKAYLKEYPYEL